MNRKTGGRKSGMEKRATMKVNKKEKRREDEWRVCRKIMKGKEANKGEGKHGRREGKRKRKTGRG